MPNELAERYASRIPALKVVAERLEAETREALAGHPHIDRIYFRVKTPERFAEKARDPSVTPPYEHPLVEIEDQIAGRILVFFLRSITSVIEGLTATFTTVESTRKRPAKDEEFGYESHHLICTIPPQALTSEWRHLDDPPSTFELQVRTLFMHAWAEPQHDLAYKGASELTLDVRRELSWVAASAWGADQGLERVVEWESSRS